MFCKMNITLENKIFKRMETEICVLEDKDVKSRRKYINNFFSYQETDDDCFDSQTYHHVTKIWFRKPKGTTKTPMAETKLSGILAKTKLFFDQLLHIIIKTLDIVQTFADLPTSTPCP